MIFHRSGGRSLATRTGATYALHRAANEPAGMDDILRFNQGRAP